MEASIGTGRSPLTSRRARIRSVDAPLVNPPIRQGLFKLAEEPNERQRKSYTGETRLMSPSPLTIVPILPAALPQDLQGSVQVKLVSESGADEDDSILEGEKFVVLDRERKAVFPLKLVKNSRRKFRLKFTVNVTSNGRSYTEHIFSLPFGVITTKKSRVRTPELTNMHLKYGLGDRENEVWIKGRNFSARNTMEVMFGDLPANILETDENLIICMAPPMLIEPGRERQVEVKVSNIDPRDGKLEAEQCLIFTYCGPTVNVMKEEPMPQFNWNMEANSFFNQFPA